MPFFAAFETAARPWRRYLRRQAYRLAGVMSSLAPELTYDSLDHEP
ncbi:MAG: hypothetical protein R3F53_18580 [Gammaproteobacteria bacterium]